MRVHLVRLVACASLILVAAAGPLAAQAGVLQGTVSDSAGGLLANASVTVEGTGLRATTGANGGYEVRGVPAGTHTVRVRLIGFQAASAAVTVAGGDVVAQDFTLAESTVAARADGRGRRLARAAHGRRRAGGAGGRVPGGAAPAAGQHRDERRSSRRSSPSINFSAAERDRRRRHRAAVHAARPEPRPHAGAGQRLAAPPDGAGATISPTAWARARAAWTSTRSRRARSTASRCCATAPRRSTAPTPSPAWSTW